MKADDNGHNIKTKKTVDEIIKTKKHDNTIEEKIDNMPSNKISKEQLAKIIIETYDERGLLA